MIKFADYCVYRQTTIREVIQLIDRTGSGIALAIDDDRHLIATLTDGDIRRAILAGIDLQLTVVDLLQHHSRVGGSQARPLTASLSTPDSEKLRLMTKHVLRHLPVLDDEGRVVDLALLSDMVSEYELPIEAVIMAGGLGKRLLPLTRDVPKPMLLVGGRPLLEHTVAQLRQAGFRRIHFSTGYKSDVIANHFGDGSSMGVEIRYVNEERPLGTAGALRQMAHCEGPLLIMNGDILTRVDFRAMLDFHSEHKASITVGVRRHEFQIPYGVVESSGVQVRSVIEKPVRAEFINAGIYLVNPEVCRVIPDTGCDMPELINGWIARGGRVISFPVREYWLDIGQVEDYERAKADAAANCI
jgi:dTDP-glucose pyrophosphorylase/CBS domain-containing protein